MPKLVTLAIEWAGPFTADQVIDRFSESGEAPMYGGEDYGIYQIYGEHILAGKDALLYVGRATDQTFSYRFRQHRRWLENEYPGIRVHLGRLAFLPKRHNWANGSWGEWDADVRLVENILIYKYSPHYNSMSICDPPNLLGTRVVLEHGGDRGRLHPRDIVPADWE